MKAISKRMESVIKTKKFSLLAWIFANKRFKPFLSLEERKVVFTPFKKVSTSELEKYLKSLGIKRAFWMPYFILYV